MEQYESQWPFACSELGQVATVVDGKLEIRAAQGEDDGYSNILYSFTLPSDLFAHFSRITWSSDGTYVAVASSTGAVYLFHITENENSLQEVGHFSDNPLHSSVLSGKDVGIDYAHAICGMSFVEARSLLVTLSFSGNLKLTSFTGASQIEPVAFSSVSPDTLIPSKSGLSILSTGEEQIARREPAVSAQIPGERNSSDVAITTLSSLSISSFFSTISCFEYVAVHNLILVAGTSPNGIPTIKRWRLVVEAPYFVEMEVVSPFVSASGNAITGPLCAMSSSADGYR